MIRSQRERKGIIHVILTLVNRCFFFFLLTEHLMELLELSHIRGEVTQTGFPFWGSAWEGQMTHHIVDGRGEDPGSILEHRLIRGEKE